MIKIAALALILGTGFIGWTLYNMVNISFDLVK